MLQRIYLVVDIIFAWVLSTGRQRQCILVRCLYIKGDGQCFVEPLATPHRQGGLLELITSCLVLILYFSPPVRPSHAANTDTKRFIRKWTHLRNKKQKKQTMVGRNGQRYMIHKFITDQNGAVLA